MRHGRPADSRYQAEEGKTYPYGPLAGVLHPLDIDHEKRTVRKDGIDRRLTDVHGHVVHEVLA